MNIELNNLFIIGIVFFLGLIADIMGRKTIIPRVTFLILIGLSIGPSGIDLLPNSFIEDWFGTITTISLGMIGFLLGQEFTIKSIKNIGKQVFYIAISKVILTFILLSVSLILFGVSIPVSLILASIASATAPAAIYEIIHELRIKSKFSKTLLSIVAFDDILALLLFSFILAFVSINTDNSVFTIMLNGLTHILYSLILGFSLGYPIAKITGRITNGEPIMIEALGAVFLVSGLAVMLELSPILATMALGSALATFASHYKITFNAIKYIEWPFMVVFFLLAGASLKIDTLFNIGMIGIIYIIVRIIGFYLGARIGAKLSNADKNIEKDIGFTLIPQAGVAIGMALMASHKFGSNSDIILPIILGTTVFFEIIGPVIARYFLIKNK